MSQPVHPGSQKVFLFFHIVWSVSAQEPLITKPLQKLLFAHLKREATTVGAEVIVVNGVESHVHILLQMHMATHFLKVVQHLKTTSCDLLNSLQTLNKELKWQDGFAAYSVSPSALKQVVSFIEEQQVYHQNKTLDQEWELFEQLQKQLEQSQ